MPSTQPDPPPPPVTHYKNTYPCTYSHREEGMVGGDEPVRRLERRWFIRGVKNTNLLTYLLYLQSTYELYLTPVKTTFRVWCLYSYLVHIRHIHYTWFRVTIFNWMVRCRESTVIISL
jgi:hypothetical protein